MDQSATRFDRLLAFMGVLYSHSQGRIYSHTLRGVFACGESKFKSRLRSALQSLGAAEERMLRLLESPNALAI